MRTGISFTLSPADRRRLTAVVIAEYNVDPKPFKWTACPDRIIAAVK